MADIQFLGLNDRWTLAHDDLQWIVQKYDGSKWRSIAFVAGKKHTLNRILDENGVGLDENGVGLIECADVALKSMPDTFKEWLRQYRSGEWVPPDSGPGATHV